MAIDESGDSMLVAQPPCQRWHRRAPIEVLDKIAEDLLLDDIRSFRLACRALSEKLAGRRFRTFFHAKTTDLTPESLASLSALLGDAQYGPLVKVVRLQAVVYDPSLLESILKTGKRHVVEQQGVFTHSTTHTCTPEELAVAQASLDWLSARQQARLQSGRFEAVTGLLSEALGKIPGRLEILELDAVVQKDRGPPAQAWEGEFLPVWVRAAEVYRVAMSAVARSGVEVAFVSVYQAARRCSVDSVEVTRHLAQLQADAAAASASAAGSSGGGGAAGLSGIRAFAISTSTRVRTDIGEVAAARENLEGMERIWHESFGGSTKGDLYGAEDPEAQDPDNFVGVAGLVRMMPNLEELDVHLYDTINGPSRVYARLFEAIAEGVTLPRLRALMLRGLPATEASMLSFLERHKSSIRSIVLMELRLTCGAWRPIFELLSDREAMPNLESLVLSNLWSASGLINLIPAARELTKEEWAAVRQNGGGFPCLDGAMVHTREFGPEVLRSQGELVFRPPPEQRPMGSPQLHNWRTRRRAEYGPP